VVGVLLLNAVLTVRAHQANSHKDHGWEKFTDAVIAWLNKNTAGTVFMLWGSYAQKKGACIDKARSHSSARRPVKSHSDSGAWETILLGPLLEWYMRRGLLLENFWRYPHSGTSWKCCAVSFFQVPVWPKCLNLPLNCLTNYLQLRECHKVRLRQNNEYIHSFKEWSDLLKT